MDSITQPPPQIAVPQPKAKRRSAFIHGATAGARAGFVANAGLAVAVGVGTLIFEETWKLKMKAPMGFALYLLIGGIVAAMVGSIFGALGGSILGALKRDRLAPVVFSAIAGGVPLIAGITMTYDGEFGMLVHLATLLGAVYFGAIGFTAGEKFAGIPVTIPALQKPFGGKGARLPPPTPNGVKSVRR